VFKCFLNNSDRPFFLKSNFLESIAIFDACNLSIKQFYIDCIEPFFKYNKNCGLKQFEKMRRGDNMKQHAEFAEYAQ